MDKLCDALRAILYPLNYQSKSQLIPMPYSFAPSGGGVQKAREESHLLSPWLQRARERNIPIAAVSNAPFFLAEAGLLKDKVATIYPPAADEFRQTYTSINLRSERAITDAGNLLCANGIASGCDMVTSLIERLYGEDIARQISHDFLLGFKRDYNIANISFDGQKFHNDEQILEAQHYLETHYAKDIKVEIIASQIGMSPRNFSRRFKKATGDTPNHYLQHIRIAMAKDLLRDHDLSIAEVAYQVGYSDLSYFSRIFSRHAGCQPHIYREEAK